ncbi:2-succinyl-5-enolpyruvyl-6-hydroxy-3-cyclohexene- 1-carboxylate synthase [Alicyclobacillus contaminans]|uniref:2-succinyl-5-enolpyruvyl-6-hydroxy-3- cyclohexene-1-carboxylic-acid synthase n=1 Tax=Alicyclobacillus contaminans TaxID=392016 RepID=UPI0004039BC2|nr:2-succinyl-5-enolpyruvyl-6-hydroxy-3-cyclohexene-1-carboxylic-acid synthase [Alicyclobacillus contaminans]GMA52270.1 2-succinyl-5-enolpyruvyl-6-hydroxy-3-cyclohexene- 1-carboxylate synthase [Alicyclobacillus contaminans]
MTENDGLYVVTAFVEALRRAGVRHVCISPGSRSTPLTMAVARHGGFQLWTLLDERSAAYFALGLARSSGSPTVLICTSGTATANYFPAVMEARQSEVPLILITADRPPELHDVGSNQTVRQAFMYSDYAKWSVEMPVPVPEPGLVRHARATAWRAVVQASSAPRGPVHINWPFREPLVPPREVPAWAADVGPEEGLLQSWHAADLQPSRPAVLQVASLVRKAQRGLIICGPQDSEEAADALLALADALQWPILADPLSQLRGAPSSTELVMDTYDLFLRTDRIKQAHHPDVVLRFGRTPTSKALGQFLSQCGDAMQVVISPNTQWVDPFLTATHLVHADPAAFCHVLLGEVERGQRSAWTEQWMRLNETARNVVAEWAEKPAWNEGRLFVELSRNLPDGTLLFAGNSMPVRDMDDFFLRQTRRLRTLSNRGVSGIDGVVSTALGAAAAHEGPTVLVIGDVSFYHDLNGLLAAKQHALDVLVLLVNNDGGGIFSFLPQAAHADTFPYFRTAHGLAFEPVVEMYGGVYCQVRDWTSFSTAFADLWALSGLRVLELRTDGDDNVRWHQALMAAVDAALAGVERWNE